MRTRLAILSALMLAGAAPLQAQAYVYPAMQTPRIVKREYNVAIASISNGGGTALVGQWREGLSNPKLQFIVDAGLAMPEAANADTRLLAGGGLAYQAVTESAETPVDVAVVGGLGFSTGGDVTTLRIPIGASIGRRFPLEKMAITPFAHPRLTIDRVSSGSFSNSNTNFSLDLGASLDLQPGVAVRLALAVGDDDAIAVSFAWTPKGSRK